MLKQESEIALVGNAGIVSEKNALERVYDYFIKETSGDPIPFDKKERLSLFLELLGGSVGIYAWPPAQKYAKDKAPWIHYSFVLTNPLSNVLFLIKATDDFFKSVSLELRKPPELEDILETPRKKELAQKYAKIMTGAAVCAAPFAITTYLFPLPGCSASVCLGVIVAHSEIANAILHAISWGLILAPQYWYYRLPFLPFEKLYECLKEKRYTQTERSILSLKKEKEAIYQKYRDKLTQFFSNSSISIVDDYTKRGNKKQLRGFEIFSIPGRGNCVFQSISDQLQCLGMHSSDGQLYTHETLRALASSKVSTDDALRGFFTDEDLGDLQSLGGWVGHPAMQALANILKVTIHIMRDDNLEHDVLLYPNFADPEESLGIIRLYYNGVHYDSLRDTSALSTELIGTYSAINRRFPPLDLIKQKEASIMTMARVVSEGRDLIAPVRSCHAGPVVGCFGALAMVTGCLGWIANPIYLGSSQGLSLLESIAVGFLPAYSTGVLCAFYGVGVFSQIYEYLTSGGSFMDKLSLDARLYPKMFAAFLAFNLYVAAFSYGVAQELIETSFGDEFWTPVRPFLEYESIPALVTLSFVPLLGLYSAVTRESVAKFGADNDHTVAARLLVKSVAMAGRLQQLKGTELIASLQSYGPDELSLLGINSAELARDIDQLTILQGRIDALSPRIEAELSGQLGRARSPWTMAAGIDADSQQPLLKNEGLDMHV